LELPPEELKAIIGADELNMKSEAVVWDGVVRWINHEKENRNDKILELMKKVRLRLLSRKFIRENIMPKPYVARNYKCHSLIDNVFKSWHRLEVGEIPDEEFARPRIPNEILFLVGGRTAALLERNIQIYDIRAKRCIEVEEIIRSYSDHTTARP
jgi:hypothetical protein